MDDVSDLHGVSPGPHAAQLVAGEHPAPTAADAAHVFKRPTPSISVLLSNIPPVHGKLPPLRSSADGAAVLPSLDNSQHQLGHLQHQQQPAGLTTQQQQQQQQQHTASAGLDGQLQHQQPFKVQSGQQLLQQQPQAHSGHQLRGSAELPNHSQDSQAREPQQQLQRQEQVPLPPQQPKQSWVAALHQPREFFLRFSQLRSSTAAVEAELAPRQSLQLQAQGSMDDPQLGQQQQQQEQQQQQHWCQNEPSLLMPRSGGAQVPNLAADPQPIGTGSSNSKGNWAARRVRVLQLLDSPAASWVLIVMSLFVIFQEDFKYAVLPPPADLWFESITLALLITFLLEIGLSCLVRPGFFLSFYFWLDTVAVLSLAFELPALRAVLLLGETQEYVNLNNSDSYLMAAGAQALVSSKAGRAAKVVRLFRQLQLIKLFKQLELRQRLKRVLAEGAGTPAGLTAAEAQVLSKYKHSESRVGQRLSDLTMKRVITGILAMLIVLPALEITSGINGSTASLPLGGLEMLHMQALTGGANSSAFDSSLKAFQRNVEYQLAGQRTGGLLRLVLANTTYVSHPTFTGVGADKAPGSSNSSNTKQTAKQYRRYLEMQAAYAHSWLCPSSSPVTASAGSTAPQADTSSGMWPQPQPYFVLDASAAATAAAVAAGGDGGGDVGVVLMDSGCLHMQSFVLLDIKWSLQAQSVYGIARTLFLVCLLGLGSYLIHSDTYRLVLQPVQRMVERVREMAEDPLMLAAVRTSPPAPGLSGAGDALKGSDNRCSTPKGVPHPTQLLALPASPTKGDAAAPAAATELSSSSSGDGSKRPKIRFWTTVRVHAVADGMEPSSPTAAAGPKGRPSVQHQQLFSELQQGGSLAAASGPAAAAAAVGVRPRASGTQLMVAQARRMSARVSAHISAAGRVAAAVSDRWRVQLVQRASAIKHMMMVDESEQETGQGQYETRLLEQSIYKICALLAVGFGDAGAEVIAENIKKDGDLNPCMPGKKTVAVFGFCDIRRFTDTTEVLQEGVMEFVNVIAHLVHSAVAARGGAANKNIGDAFLLVWKLPKGLDDKDVCLLSSGGLLPTSSTSQHGPDSPPVAMRTATLNWPGLLEEVEGAAQPHGNADSSPRNLSLLHQSPRSSPTPLPRPSSSCQAAADMEISHMLQQQAAQMSMKRAASGIMEGMLPGGGGKRHSGGASGSPHTSGIGGAVGAGDASQAVEGSGLSRSGLRRAMLSIKSVAATPLSAAAKASIINTIADSALASFVVIQVAICVSRVLKAYSNKADLTARMPGFRVQMGFGLHVGWAIEGAIGSEYKIDASYLSPNVNLASRLEAATKQYSVPMLLSRDFVDCLSPGVRAKVRQIDCVTVKGSCQPLGLFCYDLDLAAAEAQLAALSEHGVLSDTHSCPGGACANSHTSSARSLLSPAAAGDTVSLLQQDAGASSSNSSSMNAVGCVRHSLAVMPGAASAARSSVVVSAGHTSRGHEEQGQAGVDPAELLLSLEYDDDWTDNPVVAASWAITWDFKEAFDEAFEDYIAGAWPRARDAFEELLMNRRAPDGSAFEDSPTRTLLAFMASHDYVAPEGWVGVRELTEK